MNAKPQISPKPAFISIGSNIDPESNLPRALQHLHALGFMSKVSKVYQNVALDRPEQPDYLNSAVLIETNLEPLEIRERLRQIESDLDRVRTGDKYAPRTIDLDLCLLGDRVFFSPELILPDPELVNRAHLAIPLSELDPEHIHPLTCENLAEIAGRLEPNSQLTYREDITSLMQKAVDIYP